MISVTELRSGSVFEEKSDYFLVINYEHSKIARGSGTVKVKVKNLSTGAIIDKTFTTGARVQEASLDRKKVQYLYMDETAHVMSMSNYEQFNIEKRLIEDFVKFLKEGMEIELFSVGSRPLFIQIPKIVDYEVKQAGGDARGNTVGAAQKDAVMENGLSVKVPLFIKTGEVIRVDTRSGEYVERAK